jgi:hypothetical protein
VEQLVIVVTMMGGLGNQMFQYATGRAISERTGRRLVLDTTMMPSGGPPYVREFLLDALPIDKKTRVFGRTVGALAGSGSRSQPFVADVRAVLRRTIRRWTVSELVSGQELPMDLRMIPDRLAVLYGYWQSPSYFEDSAALIRRELLPPSSHDSAVAQLLRRLDRHDIIAVHARRGDYVTLDHVARVFDTLDAGHFVSMGTRIAEQCDRPAMVVLCEDTDWAKAHLRFDAPTFYAEESAPLSAIEGMALLSRAQHHVLSNSSYSWWGAWLADHPDQVVIRPRRWLVDEAIDETSRWPDDWTTG